MVYTQKQFKPSAGIRPPKSGRIDMHPDVIDVVKSRYKVDISFNSIKQITPDMVDENTLVIVLFFEEELLPDYLYALAFDILDCAFRRPLSRS